MIFSGFIDLVDVYKRQLVDTYNVLKSGVPTAIRVFKEMKPEKMGIRIDSGDITYLTKQSCV